MSIFKRIANFFKLGRKRDQQIFELRKSLLSLEVKIAYLSKEVLETQTLLENVAEILAQVVLEQNAISTTSSIKASEGDYVTVFPTGTDDDDLLN